MDNISAWIRKLRRKVGMSQREFGKAVGGAHWRTVQNWEAGEFKPSFDYLKGIEAVEAKAKRRGAA